MIWLLLTSFFTLAIIGVPVGIVVALTTLFGFYYTDNTIFLSMVAQRMFSATTIERSRWIAGNLGIGLTFAAPPAIDSSNSNSSSAAQTDVSSTSSFCRTAAETMPARPAGS